MSTSIERIREAWNFYDSCVAHSRHTEIIPAAIEELASARQRIKTLEGENEAKRVLLERLVRTHDAQYGHYTNREAATAAKLAFDWALEEARESSAPKDQGPPTAEEDLCNHPGRLVGDCGCPGPAPEPKR